MYSPKPLHNDIYQIEQSYQEPYLFTIFFGEQEICQIELPAYLTTSDLFYSVKTKIGNKYGKIVGLSSLEHFQVMDYTLMLPHFPISRYKREYNHLQIVLAQPVSKSVMSVADFEFIKCLGKGGSAVVYLVRHCSNGMVYALKQVQKTYFKDFKKLEQILRQRKIMIELTKQHPFTSQLIATFESERHLNILLQYYPGGELFFNLQRRRLSQNECKLYIAEITVTLDYLHNKKIIYRDLKPQNVMIDIDGHARLADFGLCKLNLSKTDRTISYCGSMEYMAPQVKSKIGYNYSVDFYTLGALAYEMIVGVPPFYNKQPLYFPEDCTPDFIDLITNLIQTDTTKRIDSFQTVKKANWFKDIDWNRILTKEYLMAYQISPYQSYIHEEFKEMLPSPLQKVFENKYDQLLTSFYYIRESQDSPYISYRHANDQKESIIGKTHSSDYGLIKKSKKKSTIRITRVGTPVAESKIGDSKNRPISSLSKKPKLAALKSQVKIGSPKKKMKKSKGKAPSKGSKHSKQQKNLAKSPSQTVGSQSHHTNYSNSTEAKRAMAITDTTKQSSVSAMQSKHSMFSDTRNHQ